MEQLSTAAERAAVKRRRRENRANERAALVARLSGQSVLAARIAAREQRAARAFIARFGAARHAEITRAQQTTAA